jgi:hypothetical protein
MVLMLTTVRNFCALSPVTLLRAFFGDAKSATAFSQEDFQVEANGGYGLGKGARVM